MMIFLLETDCYDQRIIRGAYSTAEAAMAAWQPCSNGEVRGHEYGEHAGKPFSYTWQEEEGEWTFDADWEDYARIIVKELKD